MYWKERYIFAKSRFYCLHLNLPLKTVKNLCPNLQKPPLPSKIPGYAPVYRSLFSKVPDFRSATVLKRYLCISVFLRNLKNVLEHLFIAQLQITTSDLIQYLDTLTMNYDLRKYLKVLTIIIDFTENIWKFSVAMKLSENRI